MIGSNLLNRTRCVALLFAIFGTCAAGTVSAQNLPTPVIAVVDVQLVLRQAIAAASIRQQIDSYSKEFQGKIDDEKVKLELEVRELQDQRSLLSADAYALRRQELQQDQGDLQDYVKTVRNVLNESMKQARQSVEAALIEEIGAMATEHGVNLVLTRNQALFASDTLDLTGEALSRLDVRLPEVPIEIDAVEKSNPAP